MSPDLDTPPGVFVMVVGPSGAGKDAILRGARGRLADDPGIHFARRVVTRPADGSEDNEAATPEDFAAAWRRGDFVLDWQAHGLRYGVPKAALHPLARGRHVVVNGSRAVVARARTLIGPLRVVLVTALPEVLAARIQARGRDEDARARLAREALPLHELAPDLVIDNSGPLDASIDAFVGFLAGLGDSQGG